MGPRLPQMLKDAGVTAFVAAALGIFLVGFRTYDASGKGLSFDYQFIDLAIAVATIFIGRLGLQLAAPLYGWALGQACRRRELQAEELYLAQPLRIAARRGAHQGAPIGIAAAPACAQVFRFAGNQIR